MAEERTVESLAEACRDGETYSAWTRFEALMQRRYLNPTASGNEADCLKFLFLAMDKAAVPHLSAEVAARLAEITAHVLEKYGKPVGSDYAQAVMQRVLRCFTQAASVSCQFNVLPTDSNGGGSGGGGASSSMGAFLANPAIFAVNFSSDTNGGTPIIEEAAQKLQNLIPWYACLLRFCETMLRRLANEKKLLLSSQAATSASGGGSYVGEAPMRFNDRIVTCDYAEAIQTWSREAVDAAYALVVCMASAKRFDVALPSLTNEEEADGTNSNEEECGGGGGNAAGAPTQSNRAKGVLRVRFPPRLTLATALVKLQQWATCPSTCRPSETKGTIAKAVNATVLATMLGHGSGDAPLPGVNAVMKAQCWQVAKLLFEMFCRGTDNATTAMNGATKTTVFGASDFFAVARKEAVNMAQIALDSFCATPLVSHVLHGNGNSEEGGAGGEVGGSTKDWIAFLSAWLVVMKACVESRSWEADKSGEKTAKTARRGAYLKVCNALCTKFHSAALCELPELNWMKLAECF